MKIPQLDIKAQLKPIRDDLLRAITEVVDGTHYIMGPQVAELEKQVSTQAGRLGQPSWAAFEERRRGRHLYLPRKRITV